MKSSAHSLHQTDFFTAPDQNTTGWAPPTEYPRLSGVVAIDLETKDPDLKTLGPGWPRRNGHVVGVAVTTAEWSRYYPVAHAPGGNLDPGITWRWLRDQLPQVGLILMQNAVYDVGWLRTVDIHVSERLMDTKAMAALIDETRMSYKLEALGQDYLGIGKSTSLLDTYAKQWGMGNASANIWRMPPFIVGPYAEQDGRLTYDLWAHFLPIIEAEGLGAVLKMEMDLIPVLVAMRARGVRVDVDRLHALRDELLEQEADLRDELVRLTGRAVEPWDPTSIAAALGARGITTPMTSTGLPSITKGFLEELGDPVAQAVLALRRANKQRSTFVEGAFLAHLQGDRVYPEFHPLRTDEGGAVTGRFSSSDPNFQQLPAKREEEARQIRGLVLPEPEHQWYAADYSQQEPRILVHFASLMGLARAEEARLAYINDPSTDFHQFVAELTGLVRSTSKNINLGKFYGMGGAKYARSVGLPTKWIDGRNGRVEVAGDEAQAQLDQYDARLPFVSQLYQLCARVAEQRGYIKTILGRRRRFRPVYERGASGHKGLNALVQGTAAEQNKMGMIALHRAGHTPSVVVHDETDGSCAHDPRVVEEIRTIMMECLPLNVPSKVDIALGASWGEAL